MIIILIVLVILGLLYLLFRKNRESIEDVVDKKYDIYKKLIEDNMYINELHIGDKTIMRKSKLNDEDMNKMLYYLFVPNNNMNKNMKYIVYEYLDFIQRSDLIEGDNNISNYKVFLNFIHILTGKDSLEVMKMNKEEFLENILQL
jgi:archaellum biogenesis ATPase FlaH